MSYELNSPFQNKLMDEFVSFCRKYDIIYTPEECFGYMNELPDKYKQLSFF